MIRLISFFEFAVNVCDLTLLANGEDGADRAVQKHLDEKIKQIEEWKEQQRLDEVRRERAFYKTMPKEKRKAQLDSLKR